MTRQQTGDLFWSMVIGLAITGFSYLLGFWFRWIDSVNYLEAFAVAASYSCTILCVLQSRINYPVGMIATAALTVMFYRQGLYASAALNAYLVPTLIYGWFRWGPDRKTKPVTRVELKWLPVYAAITAATWFILYTLSNSLGAKMAPLDSSLLVGSILAQFLLDNKKIETWMVWAVVNIVSIYVYWNSGLVITAIQFVFFLGNTFLGWRAWRVSMIQNDPVADLAGVSTTIGREPQRG